MRERGTLKGMLGLLLGAVAAIAALPPSEPPSRSVAGVHVNWPLTAPETTVAPGAKLVVRVSSPRRRAQLSLVRVDGRGRALRTVARRTLRKGTFTVQVPVAVAGARYALRLNVAGHKRWSWITTPSAPAPAATPAPVATPIPTAQPQPLSFCGPEPPLPWTAFAASVATSAATVTAGEAIGYTVTNTGSGPMHDTGQNALQPEAQMGYGVPRPGDQGGPLPVGASVEHELVIPADTEPGRYRILRYLSYASCDVIATTGYRSALFEVLAP
jgi:hypothetical protein